MTLFAICILSLIGLSVSSVVLDADGCAALLEIAVEVRQMKQLMALYATTNVPFACDSVTCDATVLLDGTAQELRVYGIQDGDVALLETHAMPPAAASCSKAAVQQQQASLLVGALYEGWQGPAAYAMSVVAAAGGQAAQLSVEDVIRSQTASVQGDGQATPGRALAQGEDTDLATTTGAPGPYQMSDIYDKWNASALNDGFFWQDKPQLGYYCTYRKRANETTGIIPDCPNITATLQAQLQWLTAAGVNFVTADATNLCTPSNEADVLQTRPMEVMLEEWTAFRAQGLSTPYVAAWQRAVTGCTLWTGVLDLYNNATYSDLILKDPVSGKKVLFVPDSPDPTIVAQMQSNGGRNDVLVQEMWANFDPSIYPQGRWGFMSPCTDVGSSGNRVYTTNSVRTGAGSSGCEQYFTTNSSLGTATTVSPSYQLSYGSVPFSAAGKYGTLTLKRQWGTIFERAGAVWSDAAQEMAGMAKASAEGRSVGTLQAYEHALSPSSVSSPAQPASGARSALGSALPDNIYMSSWNEFISQPQADPFNKGSGPQYAFSMGLGNAGGPPTTGSPASAPACSEQAGAECSGKAGQSTAAPVPYTPLFVDTFGTIARDIEPTVNGGNATFTVMASCVRVVKLASELERQALQALKRARSGVTGDNTDLLTAQRLFDVLSRTFGRSGHGYDHDQPFNGRLTSCAVAGEECCSYNETVEGHALVWSLDRSDGSDSLVTTDPDEVSRLTCPGCGWTQVCNAYGGPTAFCVDGSLVTQYAAMRGPFTLHTGGCGAATSGVNGTDPAVVLPGRTAVYRCRNSADGTHFLSGSANCGTGAVLESTIGCADASPSSGAPRALRVCKVGAAGGIATLVAGAPTAGQYHSLDYACAGGDTEVALLGYVH